MTTKPIKRTLSMPERIRRASKYTECSVCHEILPEDFITKYGREDICVKCLRKLKYFRCEHCGKSTKIADRVVISSLDVCPACAAAHYIQCRCCHERFDSTNIKKYGMTPYCTHCFNQHFVECVECEKPHPRNDSRICDGERYCPLCAGRVLACCVVCRTWHHREDMNHNEDKWYCDDCNPREEIMDSCYKPTPVFFGKESKIFLGIELEVECKDMKATIKALDVSEEFYLKYDGSLSSKGVEIVSMPCTLDYHKNNIKWEERCSRMVKAGTTSHNTTNCGLHIHISSDRMSDLERMKFSWFIHKEIEPIRVLSRRKIPYGRDCSDPKEVLDKILQSKNYKNGNRYDYLNWHNQHTVEFRLPKGTLKAATLLATLELCDAAVEYTKACSFSEIKRGSFDIFLMWCQGSKRNRTRYSNLIAFFTRKEKCPVLASLKRSKLAKDAHFKTDVGLVGGPVIDSDEVEDPRYCRL